MNEAYRIETRRSGIPFVALLLASAIAGSSEALAFPPLGRDAAGVIERLDEDTKTFQLRRAKDAKRMTLSWN